MTIAVLTDTQKVALRKYMGYPAYGGAPDGGWNGFRYFEHYGVMEYRFNTMTVEEFADITKIHLPRLVAFEAAIFGVTDNLDEDTVAVISRNKTELADRVRLYTWARVELCNFLGLPFGPGLKVGGSRMRAV